MCYFLIFIKNIGGYFYRVFSWVYQKYFFLFTKNTYIMSPYVSRDSQIGKYCYIGYHTSITRTIIWNYCSIAPNVSIGMGEHELDRISTNSVFYDDQYKELTQKSCTIGNDVWIWVDAIIRRGVTIGNGAVIWANSFVNKDIPHYAIVAWSPAKIIRYRFDEEKIALIEKSHWWSYDIQQAKKIMEQLTNNIHA